MKKIDLSGFNRDIFYDRIYPVFPKEFLILSDYKSFVELVGTTFILSDLQWESIKDHWDEKESLLK